MAVPGAKSLVTSLWQVKVNGGAGIVATPDGVHFKTFLINCRNMQVVQNNSRSSLLARLAFGTSVSIPPMIVCRSMRRESWHGVRYVLVVGLLGSGEEGSERERERGRERERRAKSEERRAKSQERRATSQEPGATLIPEPLPSSRLPREAQGLPVLVQTRPLLAAFWSFLGHACVPTLNPKKTVGALKLQEAWGWA